jgi:hypothetical protein
LVDFSLNFLNADSNGSIIFLPYGVTTIEFKAEGNVEPGYIRPENRRIGGEKKEYFGLIDGGEDFLVIWGAGRENGQYIDSIESRTFLNLIHLRNKYQEGRITFRHSAKFAWKQQLHLFAPNGDDMVRMNHTVKGNCANITFEGTRIPDYYSRWFPPRYSNGETIRYLQEKYPEISIEYAEDDSGINSPMWIFLWKNGHKKKIGSLQGDLRYARPHAELFALLPSGGIFVLRLWLYWIHKRFQGNFFYTLEESAGPESNYRKLGKALVEEIPDIERFDFVIDTDKGRITWYGTDFHYQEYWGKTRHDIVDAWVAGSVDLFVKTVELSCNRVTPPLNYNPIHHLKDILKGKVGTSFVKPEPKDIMEVQKTFRPLNIETHVPYVKRADIDMNLISSIISK